MKRIDEQTIKRLQKLAGINEIEINNPTSLSGNLRDYLDRELSRETDLYYLILGWIEGTSEEPPEGYISNEGNWDDIQDQYEDRDPDRVDPEFIEFIRIAKTLKNISYLSNLYDMAPQEYANLKGYNDIKIEFNGDNYIISIPVSNEMGVNIGYFDLNGNFQFFN